MAIDEDQVRQVAQLARIGLSDQQVEHNKNSLSNILEFIEQMKQVNTDNIEPMSHPLDVTQPLRADEATETNQREQMQKIAPNVQDGLYLVPKVIE